MHKTAIVFVASIILSLVFHFATGETILKYQNITINLSFSEIVIALLLFSNLVVLILFLKHKK